MKPSNYPNLIILIPVLIFCLACASFASGENDFEAMQKKMEELARKIGDPLFLISNDRERKEKAKLFADMDYHVYGEQLKYYLDVLAKELAANGECQFPPSFNLDYYEAANEIEKIE